MHKVVIDTNLLVSAIIVSGSLPDQLLRFWQKDLFLLIASQETIEEVSDVLHRNYIKKTYHLTEEKIAQLVTRLKLSAELAHPLPEQALPIHCRDVKDNILLGLALAGKADYLITGDKDLLVLSGKGELGKLKITTVKEFLHSVKAKTAQESLRGSVVKYTAPTKPVDQKKWEALK